MDWRTRFGMALADVPRLMGYGEAFRLTVLLVRDPSSHVAAAVSGWEYPMSREALVLADMYDAYATATYKKPKRYPRPWKDADKTRLGKTNRPPAEVRALLAARAPKRETESPAPTARPRDARGRFISRKE